MIRRLWLAMALALGAVPARAEQYWIAYEGNDFPENVGWTRYWGNWQGEYQGPGAYRTLHDGIITYDSLYDPGVYDGNVIKRPGHTDPGAGELFVMEWRLLVEEVSGSDDPTVVIFSDSAKSISFNYSFDTITSTFDPTLNVHFAPAVFHAYRMESVDMLTYALYVDGDLAHEGSFWQGVSESQIAWGDGTQGAASLHDWDYFRFGVIPEPSSVLVLTAASLARRRIAA